MNAIAGPAVDYVCPPDPIEGQTLSFLKSALQRPGSEIIPPRNINNNDLAFLLNVPPQTVPWLLSAPSSLHGSDGRQEKSAASAGKKTSSKSSGPSHVIRPHVAVLVRLFLKNPDYASILPLIPTPQEVYDVIQPVMRPPGEPLNAPQQSKRRWFAQLFGRTLVNSYKMLPAEPDARSPDNHRAVAQLHTLIMKRFAAEFRDLLATYRAQHMPKALRQNPLYTPVSRGWDVLRERDSLTEWMEPKIYAQFEATLYDRFRRWWDEQYMATLIEEAQSRERTYQEAIVDGHWINREPVSASDRSRLRAITGSEGGGLHRLRARTGTTFAESLWAIGMGPKAYFNHRKRPEQRLDPATSILIRHYLAFREDMDLMIPPTPNGAQVLERIQSIDPSFKVRMLGPLFGGGYSAGYSIVNPATPIPAHLRRAISLFAFHAEFDESIYNDLRTVSDDEARARGIDPESLRKQATWHPAQPDLEYAEDSDQDEDG